jgi:hypothetical protein
VDTVLHLKFNLRNVPPSHIRKVEKSGIIKFHVRAEIVVRTAGVKVRVVSGGNDDHVVLASEELQLEQQPEGQ